MFYPKPEVLNFLRSGLSAHVNVNHEITSQGSDISNLTDISQWVK